MVDTFINVLNLSDGRDKFVKALQYFLKVLLWRSETLLSRFSPEILSNLKNTNMFLGDSRRLFRLFLFVKDLRILCRGFNEKNTFWLFFQYLSSLSSFLSSLFENIGFLARLLKIPPFSGNFVWKRIDRLSDSCWTIGTIVDIVLTSIQLRENYEMEHQWNPKISTGSSEIVQDLISDEHLGALRKSRFLLFLTLWKLISDFPCAFLFATEGNFPGVIAICGFLSACFGFCKLWIQMTK